ncbi:GalNAc5-diNAcBac-PP-undecaprenol beta-1,3-glucosyltransferase [Mariprofundus micogutta]|uniref:GalNAc5-diNAcBac-PP-undecaprenol beta-1,3-glucosyltransferase n=1 Tax=Mariprofundus micogutta TaxID=1921010 RepID=A0A1L8CLG0_9PROT|nr:glycosyltransferase family 2 protein [Mariprofundus micogutta]GAV19746.1 GalNAc5-diNAcBac-PP-undecaprenol beta-1,3-glucosyltransferase [Mariprofundus micogutta]
MSSVPFFSILIPTKNRPHIVGYAIQSVLNQGFEDFEIILVDNDDSNATEKVLCDFEDPRLRYFRTGSLNMVENWSFALSKARGQYVTVLEDKQAYYPNALETIAQVISDNNSQVVVWGWDVYNDNLNLAYQASEGFGVDTIPSVDILHAYVNDLSGVWRCLPRMLNSCASHQLIHEINSHPQVDNFFSLLSPDLCAAFYQLGYTEELSIIQQNLGLVGYFQLSNADQSLKKKKDIFEFFGKGDYSNIVVNSVPIKETKLLHNSVYNDYLRVRKKIDGRLSSYQMTPEIYAKMCLSDFARLPYEKRNNETFKAILEYMKQNQIPKVPLLLTYIKCYLIRKLGEIALLSNMRDRRKKKTWKADNILDATLVGNKS